VEEGERETERNGLMERERDGALESFGKSVGYKNDHLGLNA